MKPLLHEIQWSDPLLEPIIDPILEKEIKKQLGGMPYPDIYRRLTPQVWLIKSLLYLLRIEVVYVEPKNAEVVMFVSCQQNSCRYCYGNMRATLQIIGYSDKRIEELERDVNLADGITKQLVDFTRKLADSNPRPAKEEMKTLEDAGMSGIEIAEISGIIVSACFMKRVSTFLAMPPNISFEKKAGGYLKKILKIMVGKKIAPRKVQPYTDIIQSENMLFNPIISVLGNTKNAMWLKTTIDGCFASKLIRKKVKLLMFGVISRALSCDYCMDIVLSNMTNNETERETIEHVLSTFESDDLSEVEKYLLNWTRETIWYKPIDIQNKTTKLKNIINNDAILIDAVGTVALANSIIRLAMLL